MRAAGKGRLGDTVGGLAAGLKGAGSVDKDEGACRGDLFGKVRRGGVER